MGSLTSSKVIKIAKSEVGYLEKIPRRYGFREGDYVFER